MTNKYTNLTFPMGQPATFQIHKFAKSRLPWNPAHVRTVESCRRTNLLPFSSILQLREARTPFTPSAILKTDCARAHNIRWAATKPWRRNGGQLHQGPGGTPIGFCGRGLKLLYLLLRGTKIKHNLTQWKTQNSTLATEYFQNIERRPSKLHRQEDWKNDSGIS